MKKILLFSLISSFLYVTLILSHVHNHPLDEPGDETCPAYIISSTINGEQLPLGLSDVADLEFSGDYLSLFKDPLESQNSNTSQSKRAPPALSQATVSSFL